MTFNQQNDFNKIRQETKKRMATSTKRKVKPITVQEKILQWKQQSNFKMRLVWTLVVLTVIYAAGVGSSISSLVWLFESEPEKHLAAKKPATHENNAIQTQTIEQPQQPSIQYSEPQQTAMSQSRAKEVLTLANAETIASLGQYFRRKFVGGNWYYMGTESEPGLVKAYIQIPERMEMNETQTSTYIQVALCPSRGYKTLWQSLDTTQLEVHLYSTVKSSSVSAVCKA
ncbi:hypothetical protein C2869_14245 [Saccharobesus litoralis]|uniref:Uncharacterized protein n=2 Tax=Saccharobesus litoralis TaxID=2172099 RepID=A0A2S0VTH7_9ALTE|nr:hypothetical protein C2869_14245 [Saccharobesus litoralis]